MWVRTFYFWRNYKSYSSLEESLFFDTKENSICAYIIDNIYNVKYKLYELKELLPGYFMRISSFFS